MFETILATFLTTASGNDKLMGNATTGTGRLGMTSSASGLTSTLSSATPSSATNYQMQNLDDLISSMSMEELLELQTALQEKPKELTLDNSSSHSL